LQDTNRNLRAVLALSQFHGLDGNLSVLAVDVVVRSTHAYSPADDVAQCGRYKILADEVTKREVVGVVVCVLEVHQCSRHEIHVGDAMFESNRGKRLSG
jgi:hypothetical protein